MALISNIRREFTPFNQKISQNLITINDHKKSKQSNYEQIISLILIRLFNLLTKETKLKLDFSINLLSRDDRITEINIYDKEYEVLYILGHRYKQKKICYQIQWTGYPRELTLEPEENLMTGCTQMLSKYNEFVLKYGNPLKNAKLRQRIKKWLRPPLAGRKSVSDYLLEKVLPNVGPNNEILSQFFDDLISKKFFSLEYGMNSISMNINNKWIEIDKTEAEVYVWYKLYQQWITENPNYYLFKSLVGTNCLCTPIQNKSRKELNKLNESFPYISKYGFKSNSTLKIDLFKRLKETKNKAIIGIMAFKESGRYFDCLHSSVFIVKEQKNGICLYYIDPWRDVGSTGFSRIIYNIFKDAYKNITEFVSYGTQCSGSTCFYKSLQVIASLLDNKPIDKFIWRKI